MNGLATDYSFSNLFGMEVVSEDRDVNLESAELAFDKALIQYDALDRLHDLNLREAALQCYVESADADTSISYLEAAEGEISDKKQSALKRLWEKLKDLLHKLKEKFFGKQKGPDLPREEEFYVKKPFGTFLKKVKSLASGVNAAILNTKKETERTTCLEKIYASSWSSCCWSCGV